MLEELNDSPALQPIRPAHGPELAEGHVEGLSLGADREIRIVFYRGAPGHKINSTISKSRKPPTLRTRNEYPAMKGTNSQLAVSLTPTGTRMSMKQEMDKRILIGQWDQTDTNQSHERKDSIKKVGVLAAVVVLMLSLSTGAFAQAAKGAAPAEPAKVVKEKTATVTATVTAIDKKKGTLEYANEMPAKRIKGTFA